MKNKKYIALGLAVLLLAVFSIALIKRFNTRAQETKTFTTKVTVGNSAPTFTVDPAESPISSSTSPTTPGNSITFSATAIDPNNHSYYLIICPSSTPPTGAGPSTPPSCGSGTHYCRTENAVASGSPASCQYQATSTAWQNDWYAFVCDNYTTGACSAYSQGTATDGSESPFYVNHPPVWTTTNQYKVSGPVNPLGSVTWSVQNTNPGMFDPDGHDITLLVCKTQQMSGGVCTGGEWCHSSPTQTNPTCSWTVGREATGSPGGTPYQGTNVPFTVNNIAPVVSLVKLNAEASPITLVAGGTKSVSITADVSDDNGCSATELPTANIKAYVYRSGLANGFSDCDAAGDANGNHCYAEISCTRGTCSGTTVPVTCSVAMQYYADPTDLNNAATNFATQHWVATVKATDNGFSTGGTNPLSHNATSTKVVEVASLAAFDITEAIDYGNVGAGATSNEGKLAQTIVTTPTGNVPMNQLYSGTNMCTDHPTCATTDGKTPINVNKQKYALAANTDYATGGTALSATPTLVNINIPKVSNGTVITRTSWWGIEVPTNTIPGVYNGLNTITSQIKTT